MKYLKSYKVFESNWYDIKDHLNVLADMSLPLWDKDFNVQVADEIISREHQCIVVNIVKKGSNKFTYPEIKDELLEMVEYMDKESWEILNMEFMHIASGYLYCKLDGDKLVNTSGEEIDYQFDHLIVKFVERGQEFFMKDKKNESTEEDVHRELMIRKYGEEQVEECDTIISNISDMLLELKDFGLSTVVGYAPMTILSIDPTPKISVEINGSEELFDSNYDLIHMIGEQIKDYAKDFRFVVGDGEWTTSGKKVYSILIQK